MKKKRICLAYLKSMREWQKKYGMDYLSQLDDVQKMTVMLKAFSKNGISLKFKTIKEEEVLFVHATLCHESGETIFTIKRLPEYIYDCTDEDLAVCKLGAAIKGTHEVFCEYMEELGYEKKEDDGTQK